MAVKKKGFCKIYFGVLNNYIILVRLNAIFKINPSQNDEFGKGIPTYSV